MEAKFYDPLGRECGYEAFCEWQARQDLKEVRVYEHIAMRVRLLWNDKPITTFDKPEVFILEISRKSPSGEGWTMDRVMSGATFRYLNDAIDGYQEELIRIGLAVKNAEGVVVETDNFADATTHELEFNIIDSEECEEDVGVTFDMPSLSAPLQSVEVLRTDKVGAGFEKMADGNEAW